MKRPAIILIYLTLLTSLSFGQSQSQVDSLLTALYDTKKSKDISTQKEATQIISFGDKVLPLLTKLFSDNTPTEINSECQGLKLTKGEVAIILADRIEIMPYALLTHIQNCSLEFCNDNPNLIEYYLNAIRRDGVEKFQNRYTDWLDSKDRKQWNPYLTNNKIKLK
ncbi:hypothetical protein GS399_03735 [Pedobacter sp. HMF7647]|uniref:Uncharacterized protein n=1 Tax=Hufsiella arboris TaxID=2695275 RepID=A0A7K1Y6N1_9SPHI|nr:hypothetical protein [Hufsiella arboris]MXV50071.1 hypothetical protein [Hufsiella arboris]